MAVLGLAGRIVIGYGRPESKTRLHRPRAESSARTVWFWGERVRATDFLGGMMRKLFLGLVTTAAFVGCKCCESCKNCGGGSSGHVQNVNSMTATPNTPALAGKAMQQGPAAISPTQTGPQQMMPLNSGTPMQIGGKPSSMDSMTR